MITHKQEFPSRVMQASAVPKGKGCHRYQHRLSPVGETQYIAITVREQIPGWVAQVGAKKYKIGHQC